MISDKTIETVRNLDIEEVLKSWGLEFRRRGSTMFASCPFHSEKTPSFSITPGRNLWYCHSCHRGGDGIRFYMEREGMDFLQAVEAIAKANNLHIEYTREEQTGEQREAAKLKESVLAAVATAFSVRASFGRALPPPLSVPPLSAPSLPRPPPLGPLPQLP